MERRSYSSLQGLRIELYVEERLNFSLAMLNYKYFLQNFEFELRVSLLGAGWVTIDVHSASPFLNGVHRFLNGRIDNLVLKGNTFIKVHKCSNFSFSFKHKKHYTYTPEKGPIHSFWTSFVKLSNVAVNEILVYAQSAQLLSCIPWGV